tara:strand:+ start:113 stop:379 length:267 start_codon:yes stop_codon:yes gene_type:complete
MSWRDIVKAEMIKDFDGNYYKRSDAVNVQELLNEIKRAPKSSMRNHIERIPFDNYNHVGGPHWSYTTNVGNGDQSFCLKCNVRFPNPQ